MSTILPFDQGTALIDGIDLTKDPAAIREKISSDGAIFRRRSRTDRSRKLADDCCLAPCQNKQFIVQHLLERFDLVDASNRLVKNYSGGMRRRLDIAMSFIGEPDLLFWMNQRPG